MVVHNLIIILLLLFIFSCNDGSKNTRINQKEEPVELKNNCIKLIAPSWTKGIDLGNAGGYFKENLEDKILRAYIKNICNDTIHIPVCEYGLFTHKTFVYLSDGQEMVSNVDDLIDTFYYIKPNDSMLLNITTLMSNKLDRFDSIKVLVEYRIHGNDYYEKVKIDKLDFYESHNK